MRRVLFSVLPVLAVSVFLLSAYIPNGVSTTTLVVGGVQDDSITFPVQE
ncbi:hypothetical protein [Tumebacillus lipolyticus]|uniref:Uncharacterized protein n=1 Tax=Tumebacillus lipolyticus TaxID=1280370 RepID=A0ABW4ZXI6_9BACL